jgi:hypothetical protein
MITQLEAINFDDLATEIVAIISKKFLPEEVFDKADLENWAVLNGYVKGEL